MPKISMRGGSGGGGVATAKPKYPPDASGVYNITIKSADPALVELTRYK